MIIAYTRYQAVGTLFGTTEERLNALRELSFAELQDELATVTNEGDPLPLVLDEAQFLTLRQHEQEGRLPTNLQLASDELGRWFDKD